MKRGNDSRRNTEQDRMLERRLIDAARSGDTNTVARLLNQGVDLDARDPSNGRTALHCAAFLGDRTLVDLLLERRADPDIEDREGFTPVMHAAALGHSDLIQCFVSKGVDVHHSTRSALTALHAAAANGRGEVAQLLLSLGASAMASSIPHRFTPLHSAARSGSKEVAVILLSAGADPDAKDSFGRSPLSYAAENGHEDVAILLIANGSEVDAPGESGFTPRELMRSRLRYEETVDGAEPHGCNLKSVIEICLDECLTALKESFDDLTEEQIEEKVFSEKGKPGFRSFSYPDGLSISDIVMACLSTLDFYAVDWQREMGGGVLGHAVSHFEKPNEPTKRELLRCLEEVREAVFDALDANSESDLRGRRNVESWWRHSAAHALMRATTLLAAYLRQIWLLRGNMGLTDEDRWPQEHCWKGQGQDTAVRLRRRGP